MSSSHVFQAKNYLKNYWRRLLNPHRNQYLRFCLLFLVSALTPVAMLGIFNYVVDPYQVFSNQHQVGFNQEKPARENNDRLYKAAAIVHQPPLETIILGSSRAKQGINPEYTSLKQPAYNLSLNGTNIYEVRRYLEHAVYNHPSLKNVVLGIDFFMFNKNRKNQTTFQESRLQKSHLINSDLISSLFSLDAVEASRTTLQASQRNLLNKKEVYQLKGFAPNRNMNDGKNLGRVEESLGVYYSFDHDYELAGDYLQELEKIVQICRENNLNLYVFISPAHMVHAEAIAVIGRWEALEEWKRQVVQITPVWDFFNYNSITTEKMQGVMQHYTDDSHYKPTVGNLVIDKITGQANKSIPADFGVLLTPSNVEKQISKMRDARVTWRENNPEMVKLVETKYQKFRQSLNK